MRHPFPTLHRRGLSHCAVDALNRWANGGQPVLHPLAIRGQTVGRRWADDAGKRWANGGQTEFKRLANGGQTVGRRRADDAGKRWAKGGDRKSTRLNTSDVA